MEEEQGTKSNFLTEPVEVVTADDKAAEQRTSKKMVQKKWRLHRNRFVTAGEFKGIKLVNIRQYYMDDKTNKMKPGNKGIALRLDEWKQLMEISQEVTKVMEAEDK